MVTEAKEEGEGREKGLHEVDSFTLVGETQVWLCDAGIGEGADDGGVQEWLCDCDFTPGP